MKRLLTAVLLGACLLRPVSALGAEGPDAPSPWAAQSVAGAIELGIVPDLYQWGYQREITRQEFAEVALHFLAAQYNYYDVYGADVGTLLDRLLPSPRGAAVLRLTKADCLALVPEEKRAAFLEYQGQNPEGWDWAWLLNDMEPFTDPDPDGGGSYINAAYLLGIVNGRGDGTFGPKDPITRQEAAAMLERTYRIYRIYTGEVPAPDLEALAPFEDRALISPWAVQSVALMVRNGVMDGTGEGAFSPTGPYTREQCYTTFLRLYENMPCGRARGNVDRLYTMAEEISALTVGGLRTSVDLCFANNMATVALAHYGGLPHGASYDLFYIFYEAGGVRAASPAPWVERDSFRPSDDGAGALYKSGYEEYYLDLATGESVRLTPAQ